MKISYNWLKEYLSIDLDYQNVASILTSIGLEVEGTSLYQSIKGGLEGLVIGKVITCEKHPQADRLSLTTVDIGKDTILKIVCGAPNVAVGQKVIVATIGTTLYSGEENFKIKKSKIRGEESEGMICAEDEIGLGKSHDGIIVLDENAPVGMLAKDYYKVHDDIIFEIGLTPNRIDAASHYGVARDLSAYLSFHNRSEIKAKLPQLEEFSSKNNQRSIPVEISNPDACFRYSGITISGVKIAESPAWLKEHLRSIGQKPINNVVDITNFVLHEVGQPLHAFDADKIKGDRIIVRTMPKDTKMVTLDAIERKLTENDLIIADTQGPLCIAGVFGGIDSGVSEHTQNIFLESACFSPVFVRKTSKYHDLKTEASFRFERGTDPNITVWALKRAALLVQQVAGGTISSDIIDVITKKAENFKFSISYNNIISKIGKNIDKESILNILRLLEIEIKSNEDDIIHIEVPPYRVDVQREADIIEDILRIYGYNNIEVPEKVSSTLTYSLKPDENKWRQEIGILLSSIGFHEAFCNSLTSSTYYEGNPIYPLESCVSLLNPISSELGVLRQTLLYGGLESIIVNQNRKNANVKLFEIGTTYKLLSEESTAYQKSHNSLAKYFEEMHLGLWISGNLNETNWIYKERKVDFYTLKGFVDLVLNKLGFDPYKAKLQKTGIQQNIEDANGIFEEHAGYYINQTLIAEFGQLDRKLQKKFDIENEVYYAEIHWTKLIKLISEVDKYQEIPKYPIVKRDLALLIEKGTSFDKIKQIAFKTEKQYLKDMQIFDVYEGEQISKDFVSYAITFSLLDEKATLTDHQIEKIMNNFVVVFQKELGAMIR